MHRLFLKVFFFFWLSNAAVFLLAFAVFTQFADERPERPPDG